MRERSARRRTATNSPSAAAQKPKAKPKPKSRPSSSSSPSSARRKSTPRKPAAEKRKSPTAATPAPTPTPKKAKNEYVVNKLLAHRQVAAKPGKFEYLVHWDGWSDDHDSWEPEGNLMCPDKLKEYKIGLMAKYALLCAVDVDASDVDEKLAELTGLVDCVPDALVSENLSRLEDEFGGGTLDKEPSELVASGLELVKLAGQRFREARLRLLARRKAAMDARQTEALRELECVIREAAPDEAAVSVENDVDDELPPADFKYIKSSVAGEGVRIPQEPSRGCECEVACVGAGAGSGAECCPKLAGSQPAYASNGRVVVPAGVPIYECNSRCKCPATCGNRVVQLGRQVKVGIFRTEDRGWGVRADESVKKGTFVCSYVGEVITSEEAEQRGREYDAVGRTFLFDLDFATEGPDQPGYVIDSAKSGNVSHFINHSCEPNLAMYVCYADNLETTMPQVAFFALRDIRKGEELTFDYSPVPPGAAEPEEPEPEPEPEVEAEAGEGGKEREEKEKKEDTSDSEVIGVDSELPSPALDSCETPAEVSETNGQVSGEDEAKPENMETDGDGENGEAEARAKAELADGEDKMEIAAIGIDGSTKGASNGDQSEDVSLDAAQEADKSSASGAGAGRSAKKAAKKRPTGSRKVAARPVVAYSPHNGARGRVGIKAFGCSPSTVKEAEADEEEVKPDDLDGKGDVAAAAAARNGAAMICKCGAGRCRKIVFLWGRDAQV